MRLSMRSWIWLVACAPLLEHIVPKVMNTPLKILIDHPVNLTNDIAANVAGKKGTQMATALILPPRTDNSVIAADFMPVFTVQEAVTRKGQINQFISGVMAEGEDYGKIPGTNEKKVLLKPGAEKLCSIFGLTPQYLEDKIIEDWTGSEHGGEALFYYSYRCQLSRGGRFMGEAIGSCNSWESKYRYRWVRAEQVASTEGLLSRGGKRNIFEPDFALDKQETTGKYGKPAEYWQRFIDAIQEKTAIRTRKKLGPKEYDGFEITIDEIQYRVSNPDVADAINTCQKMAQKRALVAAVLVVTNCSDAFTHDVEDFGNDAPESTPGLFHESPKPTKQQNPPTDRPIPDELSVIFGAIDREADKNKAILNGFAAIDGAFKELGSADALRMLEHLKQGFREKFPKGKGKPASIADIKACMLDMWDAYRRYESEQENVVI